MVGQQPIGRVISSVKHCTQFWKRKPRQRLKLVHQLHRQSTVKLVLRWKGCEATSDPGASASPVNFRESRIPCSIQPGRRHCPDGSRSLNIYLDAGYNFTQPPQLKTKLPGQSQHTSGANNSPAPQQLLFPHVQNPKHCPKSSGSG